MTAAKIDLSREEKVGLDRILFSFQGPLYLWEKAEFFAEKYAGDPQLHPSRDCRRDETHEFGRIVYVDHSVYCPRFGIRQRGEPQLSVADPVYIDVRCSDEHFLRTRGYFRHEHPIIPSALQPGEHYCNAGATWVVVANDDDGDAFTCSRGARRGRNDYLFLAIKREMLTQIV